DRLLSAHSERLKPISRLRPEQTDLLARVQSLHACGDYDLTGRKPARDRNSCRVVTQHVDITYRNGVVRRIDDPDGRLTVEFRYCRCGDVDDWNGIAFHASRHRRTK